MYIIKNLVYGHEMANNRSLNNNVNGFGIELSEEINGKKFEISSPYHGGQVDGDVLSVIFGCCITDDDNNPKFMEQLVKAHENEENYKRDYNQFLNKFKNDLNKDMGEEETSDEFFQELIVWLDNTEPKFYFVESSS